MRGMGLPGFGLQYRGGGMPYLLPVAGAILHLRGDKGISTVGADVDVWRDQSGSGNDARPNALLFNRPEYQAAGGVSGTPGVYFNRGGVEGMDLSTMVNASSDYTVFAVVEQLNAANATQVLLSTGVPAPGGDPFDVAVLVQNATTELGITDNVGFISSDCPSMNDEQYLTWSMDSDSGTFDCYRNTMRLGTGVYDGTGRTFNTMTTLGCRVGGALYEADMVLSEIIVFPWVLSTADRALVDAYIDARYAMVYTAIGSIEGGIVWLDPALGITSTGAGVSEWLNQSDTARNQVYAAAVDALQATDADRPLWGAATGVNGLPGVTLDAANTEDLDMAITDASTDWTLVCVLDDAAGPGALSTVFSSGGTLRFRGNLTTTVGLYDGAEHNSMASMAGEQMLTWRLDDTANTYEAYRDGTLLADVAYATGRSFGGACNIGSTIGAVQYLDATLSEFIIFNRNLNDLELAAVHAELLAKFALEFTPLSVADCGAWWDLDNATVGGGILTAITDRALGQTINVVGSPAVVSVGGADFVRFDGSDDVLWIADAAALDGAAGNSYVFKHANSESLAAVARFCQKGRAGVHDNGGMSGIGSGTTRYTAELNGARDQDVGPLAEFSSPAETAAMAIESGVAVRRVDGDGTYASTVTANTTAVGVGALAWGARENGAATFDRHAQWDLRAAAYYARPLNQQELEAVRTLLDAV